jgi:Lar family restriction alleviation protein
MKLKPCPFCGEMPELVEYGIELEACYIECVNIECSITVITVGGDKKEVIKEWNTRKKVLDKD